jgi:hypothetical protein
MKAKTIGLMVLVVAVLSIGFAGGLPSGIGKLPKPPHPTCQRDLLCW